MGAGLFLSHGPAKKKSSRRLKRLQRGSPKWLRRFGMAGLLLRSWRVLVTSRCWIRERESKTPSRSMPSVKGEFFLRFWINKVIAMAVVSLGLFLRPDSSVRADWKQEWEKT